MLDIQAQPSISLCANAAAFNTASMGQQCNPAQLVHRRSTTLLALMSKRQLKEACKLTCAALAFTETNRNNALLPGRFSFLFSTQQVDEVVLFFLGSSSSLSLPLEALVDTICHLLLACLALCLFVFPGLPLPQVLLNPAWPMVLSCTSMIAMTVHDIIPEPVVLQWWCQGAH